MRVSDLQRQLKDWPGHAEVVLRVIDGGEVLSTATAKRVAEYPENDGEVSCMIVAVVP
jgi:hypothetical protein